MPNYISKDGVWYPAKEHAVLPHLSGKVDKDGKPLEIYDGPDRAALFELFKAKVENFGINFRQDPELINRVRQLGYKNVDEYAKAVGYDKEKVEEDFNKHASVIFKHELPEKVKGIEVLGGGIDTSGMGADAYGGFGEPKI